MSASAVAPECLTCGHAKELQCNGAPLTDAPDLVSAGWIRCWRNDEPQKTCGNSERTRLICPRCEPQKRQQLFPPPPHPAMRAAIGAGVRVTDPRWLADALGEAAAKRDWAMVYRLAAEADAVDRAIARAKQRQRPIPPGGRERG